MTQMNWRMRAAALAASAACATVFTLAILPGAAMAAKKSKAAAAPAAAQPGASKQAPDAKAAQAAAARQAYDAGLKAYANGKFQPAIEQFNAALNNGGLSSSEMAKALYTRGLSQKKLGKSGLAISDFTSAMWLKNGLSDADRKAATAARAEAYNQAGLEPPSDVQQSVGVAVADDTSQQNSSSHLSEKAIAQASGAASPAVASNTAASPVTRQAPDSPEAQDAARARASYAPVNDGALQSLSSSAVGSGATAAPAPAASTGSTSWNPFAGSAEASPSPTTASLVQQDQGTAAAPAAAPSSPPSTVMGFFSNMFGGGSSAAAPPAPQQSVQVASNAPVAPEVSSWSQSTTVTTGSSHKGTSARTHVAMATPAAVPVPKGKYKIHIAAVRTRAEADALAQKLVAEHGALFANHAPMVDETVIGSMGTFYRVRIPGYASQEEPRGLCGKLRNSGFDCLVVTN